MIKTFNKLGIEVNFLNMLKVIFETPTTHIMLNGDRLKAFPLRSGTRQRRSLSAIPPNTVLEVAARTIRQKRKKSTRHSKWKGKNKTLSIHR